MKHSRVILLSGVATDSVVWDATAKRFTEAGFDVDVPVRPRSGILDDEIDFLAPLCTGAVVVGVSGGATLGVELLARGVDVSAAYLHEPAAGSLCPGLLSPVSDAFEADGVTGFGSALYGPRWRRRMSSSDASIVSRELAMFRAFEPRPPANGMRPAVLTTGEFSPLVRRESVTAVAKLCGFEVLVLPGTSHAAHLDDAYAPVVELLAWKGQAPARR